MLFSVIFEGKKNGIFPRKNIPFRQGNNVFRTVHAKIGTYDVNLQYKSCYFLMQEKPKKANLINVIYKLFYL